MTEKKIQYYIMPERFSEKISFFIKRKKGRKEKKEKKKGESERASERESPLVFQTSFNSQTS